MRLERTADFFTRHVRKFQVQYHHIGPLLSKALEACDAVRGNFHGESISLKQALQGSLHRAAIFNYQYSIHGFLWAEHIRPVAWAVSCAGAVASLYNHASHISSCHLAMPVRRT